MRRIDGRMRRSRLRVWKPTEADAFVARFPGPRSEDCPGGLRRRLGFVGPWGSAGLRGPAPTVRGAGLFQAGARAPPGRRLQRPTRDPRRDGSVGDARHDGAAAPRTARP